MKKPFPVQENSMSQRRGRQATRPSIPHQLRCDGNKVFFIFAVLLGVLTTRQEDVAE